MEIFKADRSYPISKLSKVKGLTSKNFNAYYIPNENPCFFFFLVERKIIGLHAEEVLYILELQRNRFFQI